MDFIDELEAKDHEAERARLDLQEVLEMPSGAGRRFLVRLLEYAGLYRQSYTRNADTYYYEGKRAVALWLLSQVAELDVNDRVWAAVTRSGRMRSEVKE